MIGESNEPSSEVTLWWPVSFFQITVVPASTCRSFGSKAKLPMFTVTVFGAAVAGVLPVIAEGVVICVAFAEEPFQIPYVPTPMRITNHHSKSSARIQRL